MASLVSIDLRATSVGEHQPDFEPIQYITNLVGRNLRLDHPFHSRLEPPGGATGPRREHVYPVNLFGDVGQIEVGSKRPCEEDDRFQILPRQQCLELACHKVIGLAAQCLGKGSHLLDQFEQFRTDLSHQSLAQQIPQQTDVCPESRVIVDQVYSVECHRGEDTWEMTSTTKSISTQRDDISGRGTHRGNRKQSR